MLETLDNDQLDSHILSLERELEDALTAREEIDNRIVILEGDIDDAMTEQNLREHRLIDMSDDCGEPSEPDDGMTDAEADADTLRMAGMGTDEDYGFFGSPYDY